MLDQKTAAQIWKESISTPPHLLFLYQLLAKTVQACLEGKYSNFDAHTTSNCAHGIALFATGLIYQIQGQPLENILAELRVKISEIETKETLDLEKHFPSLYPDALFNLASLYALRYATEPIQHRGRRTTPTKLKLIHPTNTRFCDSIVDSLQHHFANLIATRYSKWILELDSSKLISNAPLSLWASYIEPKYIRKDNKGYLYASCLFSMQVFFSYLIQNKKKLVIITDLNDSNHQLRSRHIYILRGDGMSHFEEIPEEDYSNKLFEPVIIFRGQVISNQITEAELQENLKPWLKNFAELELAIDTHYPQFPKARHDSDFDSSPIYPDEKLLQERILLSQNVGGVSPENPSLFYLNHIYPASLKQILSLAKGIEDDLLLPSECFYYPPP